ncbi:hypothetical protein SDC9_151565 [bioreactor metagenome]|uniref:Uncharacterized protein n=1 Tax=bioreactor metagenome TaxID=1076179 RepID=A0A645EQN1_9ZZZZ
MDAEVDQRTAAGLGLVEEPASRTAAFGVEARGEARNSAAAQPDAARIIDVSEFSGVDEVLHRPRLRVKTVAEVDSELAAELFRGVEHLLRLGGVHRHRLFAEDVRPGFEPGDGQLFVLVVRNRDREDVELLAADHVDAFGVDFRKVELLLRGFAFGFDTVGDRDDFDVGMGGVSGEVSPPHAETDDACFQLGHVLSAPETVMIIDWCRRRSGPRPLWARRDRRCESLRARDISARSFPGRTPVLPSGPRCRSL